MFILIPISFTLQCVISIFYYFLFTYNKSNQFYKEQSSSDGALVINRKSEALFLNKSFNEILLNNFIFTLLPLLPVSFTLFWTVIKFYGTISIFKTYKQLVKIKTANNKQKEHRSVSLESVNYSTVLLGKGIDEQLESENKPLNDTIKTDSLKSTSNYSINSLKHFNKVKFSLKEQILDVFSICKAILFDNCNSDFYQNLSFIYSTNFFLNLGAMTVSFPFFLS